MSVVVKKRLLEIFKDEDNNYFDLYNFFLDKNISIFEKEKRAIKFLNIELKSVNTENFDFPNKIDQIRNWCESENVKVCDLYQTYLKNRKSGSNREFFHNIAQAFEFLIKVNPTKRVDGSWLYSTVNYWNDSVFHDLIVIYLEELGLGQPKLNHVCIYDDLLHSLGLEDFHVVLDDKYYHNAVIQLALGFAPPDFIPEIIGFNLGYEQLPLHLLITNYELQELGIDSKYFNLHITIDNLSNGHAEKSLRALEKIYMRFSNKHLFMEKVRRGYALNNHGYSSFEIIKNLDVKAFVFNIFTQKAMVGKFIHDQSKFIGCKTVNEWLTSSDNIENLIETLVEKKWIKFNQNPEDSFFWSMISHEDGKMYGVFSPAEKQIIHDWICGVNYFKKNIKSNTSIYNEEKFYDYYFSYLSDDELEILQSKIQGTDNLALKICKLIPYLAPESHHKSVGLWSTKKYTEILFPYLNSPFS